LKFSIAISRPPETIAQSAYICYESQKVELLKYIFKNKKPAKAILFAGTKAKVKEIAKTLRKIGLSVGEMHSDLDQSQRDQTMHEFRSERIDILVATDIVARGIDIDDISLIVNFEVPRDVEDYVHRIGRTARAGDSGTAITLVSPQEQHRFCESRNFFTKTSIKFRFRPNLALHPNIAHKKSESRKSHLDRNRKNAQTTFLIENELPFQKMFLPSKKGLPVANRKAGPKKIKPIVKNKLVFIPIFVYF